MIMMTNDNDDNDIHWEEKEQKQGWEDLHVKHCKVHSG